MESRISLLLVPLTLYLSRHLMKPGRFFNGFNFKFSLNTIARLSTYLPGIETRSFVRLLIRHDMKDWPFSTDLYTPKKYLIKSVFDFFFTLMGSVCCVLMQTLLSIFSLKITFFAICYIKERSNLNFEKVAPSKIKMFMKITIVIRDPWATKPTWTTILYIILFRHFLNMSLGKD